MKEFVPTHKLVVDIPAWKLPKGTLLRQINPFGEWERMCFTKDDYDRNCKIPWIFTSDEIESLPEWETIRKEMIRTINERAIFHGNLE